MDISRIIFVIVSSFSSTASIRKFCTSSSVLPGLEAVCYADPVMMPFSDTQCFCKTGIWDRYPLNCYFYVAMLKDWKGAKKYCSHLGKSFLLEINSEWEFNFVKRLMEGETKKQLLMGITDAEKEGVWKSAQTKMKIDYVNWHRTQPDNYAINPDGKENCVALHPAFNYKYNDVHCSYKTEFICKKE